MKTQKTMTMTVKTGCEDMEGGNTDDATQTA